MTRQQRRYEARKGIRTTGFTPVSNGRLDAARASIVLALVTSGVGAAEAERQSWARIASQLPKPRMVRDYTPKPSKSDDPNYRRAVAA